MTTNVPRTTVRLCAVGPRTHRANSTFCGERGGYGDPPRKHLAGPRGPAGLLYRSEMSSNADSGSAHMRARVWKTSGPIFRLPRPVTNSLTTAQLL